MTSVRNEFQSKELDGLADLPSNWQVCRLKHLFKIQNGATPKSDVSEFWDGDLVWVTPADISKLKNEYISDSAKKITRNGLDSCGTTLVPDGSIVLSTRALIGSICIADKYLCTNQGCKSLVPKNEVNSKFYYYYLRVSKNFLNLKGSGTTFLELPTYELANFNAPLPAIDIQNNVVFFLDREVLRIENLISEKENFINLLKEKRQSLISHVVTKGLDPDVKMKDSGVEWIGEIPKHWDMIKFSHFVTIRNGQVDPKESPWCDYILIAPNHIESKSGKIIEKETAREQGAESGKYLCKKGEVIYSKIRPALAKACLSEDDEVICSADMYPMNCNHRMLNQYLLSLILSNEFTQLAILESGRVAMPKINRESLAQIKFPVPPISEQEQATEYIRSKTKRIDGLIEETKTSIDLLKEHRSALISAAVTGKIDLRDKEVA